MASLSPCCPLNCERQVKENPNIKKETSKKDVSLVKIIRQNLKECRKNLSQYLRLFLGYALKVMTIIDIGISCDLKGDTRC